MIFHINNAEFFRIFSRSIFISLLPQWEPNKFITFSILQYTQMTNTTINNKCTKFQISLQFF